MAQSKELTKQKADTVRGALERMKPQMEMALPKHLSPDRLLRITMTAVQNTPKLLDCDRTSLYSAVMACAQLGLEPDGILGQAYLVPFKGKVQFIPGYRGYIRLAFNSGEVQGMNAQAVHEGDDFSFAYGLDEHLHHVPGDDNEDAPITYFYAYAKFKDGGHVFVVLPRSKVDRIRDKSEAYRAFKAGQIKSTPWDDHYEPMGCKTAIRQLAKFLPLSVQRAAEMEDAYERGQYTKTDEYGDLVIEGESENWEGEEDKKENHAQSKMDSLAGNGETAEEEPEVSGKTENVNVPPPKSPKGFFVDEDANIVHEASGTIVPEKYVSRHEGGSFTIAEGFLQDLAREQGIAEEEATRNEDREMPGLFKDE